MAGRAIEIPSGLIPYGNSEHFLYPGQVGNFDCVDHIESNFKTIVSEIECPQKLVNFCIEPKLSYEDVFAPLFDESSVERRIDRMLSADSLGIEDKSDAISLYDQEKIAQFEKGILI